MGKEGLKILFRKKVIDFQILSNVKSQTISLQEEFCKYVLFKLKQNFKNISGKILVKGFIFYTRFFL